MRRGFGRGESCVCFFLGICDSSSTFSRTRFWTAFYTSAICRFLISLRNVSVSLSFRTFRRCVVVLSDLLLACVIVSGVSRAFGVSTLCSLAGSH